MFNSQSAASFSFDLAFMRLWYKSFENTVGKGEIAHKENHDVDISVVWTGLPKTMVDADDAQRGNDMSMANPSKIEYRRHKSILKAKT